MCLDVFVFFPQGRKDVFCGFKGNFINGFTGDGDRRIREDHWIISFDVQTGSLRKLVWWMSYIFLLVYSGNQPHLTWVLKVSIGAF